VSYVWSAFEAALTSEKYFEAHEILEKLWREEHGIRQQSAIWFAALFVHWKRGQYSGALKILDKIERDARRYPTELQPAMILWRAALNHQHCQPGLTAYQRLCLVRWAR
jgi:predicted metal-dependent hydrolase